MKKIILASASPRRKEILLTTGISFSVCKSNYEEDLGLSMKPRDLARFLSYKKAEAVAAMHKNALIIAADTFIVFQNRLLGKPHTEKKAKKMLAMLNGRAHSVITGFTVLDADNGKKASRSVETKVYFKKVHLKELNAYVKTGEPLDKAGAYAIQGSGSAFIEKIDGDFLNVVGLPLSALCRVLKKFGVSISAKQSK